MAKELIFRTQNLTKRFGPTVAVNNVSMEIFRGQITGLIGENGSGKSTITSIASGIIQPTSGSMEMNGLPHAPKSMIQGIAAGIGMIVQEQGTIPGLSIAQNLFLGNMSSFKQGVIIDTVAMNKAAKKALDIVNMGSINPQQPIDILNFQDRKLVEIAKVMYQCPEILVVDETTTALSLEGREILYAIMNTMRQENKAVIFVSHDLDELVQICDKLIVLRDGIIVKTLEREEMNPTNIRHYMVGRDLKNNYYRTDFDTPVSSEVVLDVQNITTGSGPLMNFSMQLHEGEILGIGGLSHCGMHELGRACFGEEKLLRGSIYDVKSGNMIDSARTALKHGYGYVSKDRDHEALVLDASVSDNIMAAGYDIVSDGPFLLPGKVREYVMSQVDSLSIKIAGIGQDVQQLSGGNKQKVVFGKWIGRDCKVLILDCPTRGVDVGVKATMYDLIYRVKCEGKSIIMISEEMTELIGMCDRILILKDGILNGEFLRSRDLSEHSIIDVMI